MCGWLFTLSDNFNINETLKPFCFFQTSNIPKKALYTNGYSFYKKLYPAVFQSKTRSSENLAHKFGKGQLQKGSLCSELSRG